MLLVIRSEVKTAQAKGHISAKAAQALTSRWAELEQAKDMLAASSVGAPASQVADVIELERQM